MHLYIVYGIFLIFPIVDFALAAPVLAQDKHQASDDIADMPTYPIIVLGKRVGDSDIEGEGIELVGNWIPKPIKNYIPIAKPKESSAAHGSSSSTSLEPGDVKPNAINDPAQNPEESPHLLTGVHAPLTGQVNPTYFHPDNELLGAHAETPTMPTDLGSDHTVVVEPSSPTKGPSTEPDFEMVHGPQLIPISSSTESGFEMVDMPPSGQASSTDSNRESMSADSVEESSN